MPPSGAAGPSTALVPARGVLRAAGHDAPDHLGRCPHVRRSRGLDDIMRLQRAAPPMLHNVHSLHAVDALHRRADRPRQRVALAWMLLAGPYGKPFQDAGAAMTTPRRLDRACSDLVDGLRDALGVVQPPIRETSTDPTPAPTAPTRRAMDVDSRADGRTGARWPA